MGGRAPILKGSELLVDESQGEETARGDSSHWGSVPVYSPREGPERMWSRETREGRSGGLVRSREVSLNCMG